MLCGTVVFVPFFNYFGRLNGRKDLFDYRTWQAIVGLAIFVLVFIFIIVPAVFHYNKTVQRHMIFLPWGEISSVFLDFEQLLIEIFFLVKWPKHVDFDRPDNEGLQGTINFYLTSEDGVKIGVWHIVPQDMVGESEGKDR